MHGDIGKENHGNRKTLLKECNGIFALFHYYLNRE